MLYMVTNAGHGKYLVRCDSEARALVLAKEKADSSGDMFWIDNDSKVEVFPADGPETALCVME